MKKYKIFRFRGWNKEKRDWIHGIIGIHSEGFPTKLIETICPVEPGSVGEYTGYRDYFGDLIYDGDILLQSDDVEDVLYTVHWDEDEERWGADDERDGIDFSLEQIMHGGPTPEIVGNVWVRKAGELGQ